MPDEAKDLGKLVVVYGLAPAYIQRAVFVVILSFLFFLGTMFIYYIRQNIIYFVLASAFLLIYLVMLFSWMAQRKSMVRIYERGVAFKKRSAKWAEITGVSDDGTITLSKNDRIVLPTGLNDLGVAVSMIRSRSDAG